MATELKTISVKLTCPICQSPACISCALCKKVYYCSREHQKLDLKQHERNCFPATISFSPLLGRHLIATRDIEPGELILKEKPLVSGPLGKPNCYPVCLTCFRKVSSDYACSLCDWPMCNPDCEKNPRHSEFECRIFRNRVPPITLQQIGLYEKIILLRILLMKTKEPETWKRIGQLQTHKETRQEDFNSQLLNQACVSYIRNVCKLTNVSDEDIDQALGVVLVNGFLSDDESSSNNLSRCGTYLYYYASMPAHDCRPNSSWMIQSNTEFQIRAAIQIKAGEPILQLYTQATYGTQERRQYLRDSKYFDCICTRCKDPTELGTMLSAVKCPVCQSGFLLLENPVEENSLWKCNYANCGKRIPQAFVDSILCRVQASDVLMELESLTDHAKAIKALEKTLQVHKGKTVHQNHYAIHTMEIHLTRRISSYLSEFREQLSFNERVSLAQRLVELTTSSITISDIIWPGINRHQGWLHFYHQQGLLSLLESYMTEVEQGEKTLIVTEAKEKIEQIRAIREKVHGMFSLEPEGKEEHALGKIMLSDPEEITQLNRMLKKK